MLADVCTAIFSSRARGVATKALKALEAIDIPAGAAEAAVAVAVAVAAGVAERGAAVGTTGSDAAEEATEAAGALAAVAAAVVIKEVMPLLDLTMSTKFSTLKLMLRIGTLFVVICSRINLS